MKKLLLAITLVFIASLAVAQNNYQDVVYLKNGSIVRGIIVEQLPNVSLKIETADGNLFVFQMTEIEKITKERPVVQTPIVEPPVEIEETYQPDLSSNLTTTETDNEIPEIDFGGLEFLLGVNLDDSVPLARTGIKWTSYSMMVANSGFTLGLIGGGIGVTYYTYDFSDGIWEVPLYIGLFPIGYYDKKNDIKLYANLLNFYMWYSFGSDVFGFSYYPEIGIEFGGIKGAIAFDLLNMGVFAPSFNISLGFNF